MQFDRVSDKYISCGVPIPRRNYLERKAERKIFAGIFFFLEKNDKIALRLYPPSLEAYMHTGNVRTGGRNFRGIGITASQAKFDLYILPPFSRSPDAGLGWEAVLVAQGWWKLLHAKRGWCSTEALQQGFRLNGFDIFRIVALGKWATVHNVQAAWCFQS